jgi:hypothetical protein
MQGCGHTASIPSAAERDLYTELRTSSLAYVACAEADTRQRVEELKLMYAWLFR